MQGIDLEDYGFKTKQQLILISDICDITKEKHQDKVESFMNDKDYYDDNLTTD